MTARHRSDGADDAALATAVAAGDVTALAEIYDRYAARLLGFCRSMLHNQAEAEDCLQDVFVIATTRLSGLREPALLRSWLFSVARHECLARIDKRKREVLVDEVADRPSFDPDPSSSAAVDAELAALLRDAQAGMSDRDRLLLELADRQQLAGEEFAAAVGVTRSTAYTLLARARATAKKSIGALLVARTGRDRCAELDTLLAGWDGELTVLSRKQVARHIEKCSVCDEQRSRVASAAALLGGEGEAFAAGLVSLRTRILEAAAAAMDAAEPLWFTADGWDDNGWPPQDPAFAAEEQRRRRGRLAALLVLALLLLIGGIVTAGAVRTNTVAGSPVDALPTASAVVLTTSGGSIVISSAPSTPPSLAPSTSAPTSRHTTHSPSKSPSSRPSTSASPSPTPTPSARVTTSTHPTKVHHTPTHRPTKPHPTPSKTKSSVPASSSAPATSTSPTPTPTTSTPPPTWVLTVQPGTATVFTFVNGQQVTGSPCSDPSGAGTTCPYVVPNGATVQVTKRGGTFASPSSCVGAVSSCTFAMTSNIEVGITS
ncbi:MAG TPA: sigma-70 family RNA polymerase sigma factor [Jatrophihabitantaceae bacterium]|nr:sigma-70 family RNA polymerase sigma factor [Jatrophihabitantaceae bacterium]